MHVPVQVQKDIPLGSIVFDAVCGARHTAALVRDGGDSGAVLVYSWGEDTRIRRQDGIKRRAERGEQYDGQDAMTRYVKACCCVCICVFLFPVPVIWPWHGPICASACISVFVKYK